MSLSLLGYLVLPSDNKNVESLYLCGLPAFVLSNGSSLALFVGESNVQTRNKFRTNIYGNAKDISNALKVLCIDKNTGNLHANVELCRKKHDVFIKIICYSYIS